MGFRVFSWMVAAAALLSPGAAEAGGEVDVQRLKKVLKLPTLQLRIGFGVSSEGPFEADAQLTEYDPDAEVARALAELKGDVGDASRYANLALLHRRAGNDAKANECLEKAVNSYRKRVDASPKDTALLREMAPVLRYAGLDAEAEKALRRAVSLVPEEWEGWTVLAEHLTILAYGTLSGHRLTILPNLFDFLQRPEVGPPASLPEPVASAARARLEEARSCSDRAVSAAPGKSGPLFARSYLLMAGLGWGCRTGTLRAEDFDSAYDDLAAAFGAVAAEHPEDVRFQVPGDLLSFVFVAIRTSANGAQEAGSEARATLFRGKMQELARGTVQRFERLGEGKDPKAAAVALEAAAAVRLVMEEYDEAEADARKAVTLDPERDQAWKLLVGSLSQRKQFEEMAALCRRSIAARDTSFKRLVLAKSLLLTGDAEKAEQETRIALKMDPRRLEANLGLAVLVLLRAKDPRDFEEAGGLLARARETLAVRTRLSSATDHNRTECLTVEAVYRGLTGDRGGAAECVRRLRELEPKSQDAREILEAMDP